MTLEGSSSFAYLSKPFQAYSPPIYDKTSIFLAQSTHILGIISLLLALFMISGGLVVPPERPLAVDNTSSTLAW